MALKYKMKYIMKYQWYTNVFNWIWHLLVVISRWLVSNFIYYLQSEGNNETLWICKDATVLSVLRIKPSYKSKISSNQYGI